MCLAISETDPRGRTDSSIPTLNAVYSSDSSFASESLSLLYHLEARNSSGSEK